MNAKVKKMQHAAETTMPIASLNPVRSVKADAPAAAVTTKAITQGPQHHYFGYYEMCPWDSTGRYVLAAETDFWQRGQTAQDTLTLGMVDLAQGQRYQRLAMTHSWNWQQGCFLQWLNSPGGKEIIYNDFLDHQFVSVIMNVETGRQRFLSRPVAAVSHNGKWALSINFARLYKERPGYGYANAPDPYAAVDCPADDGVHLLDLETGQSRLILSMAQIAQDYFPSGHKPPKFWVNHIQFNTDDTRFVFLARYEARNDPPWLTGMFTANNDGSDLYCLAQHTSVSHFDWRDRDHILAWMHQPQYGEAFYLCTDKTLQYEVLGLDYLTRDGHCCYSPDRRWVLDDTYPDAQGFQTLKLWHIAQQREIILGRFPTPEGFRRGEAQLRCDLHPRWSRDGRQICFDSTQDGTRQVYIMDVDGIVDEK